MASTLRRLLFSTAIATALFAQTSGVRADDLYVSGDTSIFQINSSGTVATFATGLNEPSGLAYSNGNLYVADASGSLYEYALNGQRQTLTTGLSIPEGLAVDAKGNVYEADYGTSSILKITSTGAVSTFASGIGANGLAFDAAGNLYAADINDSSIVKYTPSGAMSTVASNLNTPDALAFDNKGNLYVSENTGFDILKIDSSGNTTTFASNLNTPEGLAFDSNGNLYEADYGSNTIFAFNSMGTQSTFASVIDPFGLVAVPTAAVPESGTFLIAFLGLLSLKRMVRRNAR
jgi:sugar lactone lactonase YvrE